LELRYVGRGLKRREDLRVLLGETSYVDDIRLSGMYFLGVVRSPYANAKIRAVDFSRLKGDPNTVAYLDPAEIVEATGYLPLISAPEGCRPMPRKAVAERNVSFVGEPVAAVVVTDRYSLPDAVERVQVDYEPAQPVTDALKALESPTHKVHPNWNDNVAFRTSVKKGDVETSFAAADVVVSGEFRITRQYGAAIEPRGVIASYERGSGTLTVWSSTQWPHFVRTLLSEVLNHPENKIRVIAPDVGGGFGNKQDIYSEEILTSYAAMKLGRPVKWVATRSEDFLSTVHSGDQLHSAELALDETGRILGIRDSILADIGAYGPMSLGPPYLTLLSMTGPYRVENIDLRLTCVVTNKVPGGAYRGFGQQQATFVLERLVDMAALRTGLDPCKLRMRNLVTEFPYNSPTGRVLDSGDYVGMLKRGSQIIDDWRSRQANAPHTTSFRTGIGFAFGFEASGIGPTSVQNAAGARHKGYETMTVRMSPTGTVDIFTALSPHGQGLVTTLSQVCAELLGIEPESVTVTFGDSSATPYGFGTWGSRSAVVGAGALSICVRMLIQKILKAVAKERGVAEEELRFNRGEVVGSRDSGIRVPLKEAARIAYESYPPPGNLEATATYEPVGLTVSGGLHVAEVCVDVETGELRVLNYAILEDSGRMINPMIVEGQAHGGAAQGIGGYTLEGLEYSEDGQLLTSSFLDYLIPSSLELPSFTLEHVDTPSPLNEFGFKGVGESCIIGPSAALANAISDALGEEIGALNTTPLKIQALWASVQTTQGKLNRATATGKTWQVSEKT
jgi:carbon-monoxide dehydrogenase large subunit